MDHPEGVQEILYGYVNIVIFLISSQHWLMLGTYVNASQ